MIIEESIRELDHGHLEGLTFNEIKQNYGEFLARWRSEPAELQVPGGERLADVAERAWLGLHQIVTRHEPSDTIVVVSHNFPIVGIVCRITGTHLNEYRNFHLDPCGMSRLNRNGDGSWQVTHINGDEYAKPSRPSDPKLTEVSDAAHRRARFCLSLALGDQTDDKENYRHRR